MNIDKLAKTISEMIRQSDGRKTSAYDTTATVVRIKDNTVYVHIPGGVDETPIRRTVDAKVGDEVQVRISGGTGWIVGNSTSPPTDDTVAKTAVNEAIYISKTVKSVKSELNRVSQIAGNTAQYFWYTETGTDTGAHITEIPQDEFLTDPENGGGNLLLRSNGIAVREGLTELAQFSGTVVQLGLTSEDYSGVQLTPYGAKIANWRLNNKRFYFDDEDCDFIEMELRSHGAGSGRQTRGDIFLRNNKNLVEAHMYNNGLEIIDMTGVTNPDNAFVLAGMYGGHGNYGEIELNAKSGYESVLKVDSINAGSSSHVRANNALIFRGVASSWSSDCNNITNTGIYYIQGTALTNGPTENGTSIIWAALIVINMNGMIEQIVVKGATGKFYTREYSGSPTTWKSWIANS